MLLLDIGSDKIDWIMEMDELMSWIEAQSNVSLQH